MKKLGLNRGRFSERMEAGDKFNCDRFRGVFTRGREHSPYVSEALPPGSFKYKDIRNAIVQTYALDYKCRPTLVPPLKKPLDLE